MSKFKVAAICGSLRKTSTNMGLLLKSIDLTQDKFDIVMVEIKDFPVYNMDIDTPETFPEAIKIARQQILDCDAVLVGLPEFNLSMPGSFKNAIDWLSRSTIGPHPFSSKPITMISSAGGNGGLRSQLHFREVGQFFDLRFMNSSLCVKQFEQPQKFNANGELIDQVTIDRLKKHLDQFYDWISFNKK